MSSTSLNPMGMVSENHGNLNCKPLQFPLGKAEVTKAPAKKIKLIVKDVLMKESEPMNARKRRQEMVVVGQRAKRPKIDCSLKLHLRKIVKELINHQAGPIFSEPVDPVKLKIPDYFSVIEKPMDLGTILRKLEGNMYSGADEVVADVRLTFSNAMLYNPDWHEVHKWAVRLDDMFSRKLESLEAKFKLAKKNDDFMRNNGQDTEHIIGNNHQEIGPRKGPLPIKHGICRVMSFEEKQKFRLELEQGRRMMEKLRSVFKKFGLVSLNEEGLDSYIDSTDDETLWKLRREVKDALSAKGGNAQPVKIVLKGRSSLNKTVEQVSATESGSSCVSLKRHRLRTGAPLESASDISSERSENQNHCADSKLEFKVKYPLESCTSRCGLDSDGPVIVNEANSFHLSTPPSVEGCCTFNAPLSPKKALRAAMLKSRYADTIFKATHQELLEHSEKSDPLRIQQEKERLEREQRKERDKIEAQIKAAEAASRRREQDCLRMRMRERDAARIALEKLEKSVEFEGNVGVLEGLKMMGCDYLYYPRAAIHYGNHLHQLGLFCKVDSLEDDEDTILNIEEGEIIS